MKTTKIPKTEKTGDMWPVFDSMSQAAAMAKIPLSVLRKAKSSGCLAFKSNRVYFGEFLEWHFTHLAPVDPRVKLMEVSLQRETDKARMDRVGAEQAEGLVVPKTEARRALTRYAASVRAKLLALPRRNALPLSLLKEPLDIEQKLNSEIRQVLTEVFRGEWGKVECPLCKKEIKP